MTLTLTPETEADLAAVAAQRGLSQNDTLAEVLAQARAVAERERQEAIEGVRRSEEDFAFGHSLSLDEWRQSMDATLEAKRQEARRRVVRT